MSSKPTYWFPMAITIYYYYPNKGYIRWFVEFFICDISLTEVFGKGVIVKTCESCNIFIEAIAKEGKWNKQI